MDDRPQLNAERTLTELRGTFASHTLLTDQRVLVIRSLTGESVVATKAESPPTDPKAKPEAKPAENGQNGHTKRFDPPIRTFGPYPTSEKGTMLRCVVWAKDVEVEERDEKGVMQKQQRTVYAVTLEKTYFSETDKEWKKTSSLRHSEIALGCLILSEAQRFIDTLK